MRIERGEIWWINPDPTVGREIKKRRPCVVLSANEVNHIRATPVADSDLRNLEVAAKQILQLP